MANGQATGRAVCILGMHRSGTSLLARVVNLLGAYLGEEDELLPASPTNAEGYWEHRLICDFNDRVLLALQRTWDTAFPLPADWHVAPEIAPLEDELIELVETRFSGKSLWGWKDPRTSVLLPLWRAALAKLDIEVCCLLVARNPLDVARSLESRNGFSINEGLGLWLNYNLAMLENTRGMAREVVSYQRFLSDPEASISGWAPGLALPWSPDDEELCHAIGQFARKDLCHSASTLEDLAAAGCPDPVLELAGLIDSVAESGGLESPELENKIRRLAASHQSYSSLYNHDVIPTLAMSEAGRRYLVDRGKLFTDAEGRVQEQEQQLSALRSEDSDQAASLAESYAAREATATQLATREQEVVDAQARIAALEPQLADAGKEREALQQRLREQEEALSDAQARIFSLDESLAKSASQRQSLESKLATTQELTTVSEQELAETTAREETLRTELALAQEQIAARDDTIAQAGVERAAMEREMGEARQQLAARDDELALERKRYQRILATYSWRVTRPLRSGLDIIQAVQRRIVAMGQKLVSRKS